MVGPGAPLFERLSEMPFRLGDIADIFVGLQTSSDKVFIMDLIQEETLTLTLQSKALGAEWVFEKSMCFPVVSGTDVNRYCPLPQRQYILFPYEVQNESAELIEFERLAKVYPRTAEYLIHNRKTLEERERGKFKDAKWYRFGRSQNLGIQQRRKLCVPRLVERLYATFDSDGSHFLDNVDVGGITLKPAYERQSLLYLLALLNSRLLRWYFPFVSAPFRGGWLSANRQFLSQLPVRVINLDDPADLTQHNQLAELAKGMIALHRQLETVRTPHDSRVIQRQIGAADRQIDRLVYEWYELTDEEIRIVEGAV